MQSGSAATVIAYVAVVDDDSDVRAQAWATGSAGFFQRTNPGKDVLNAVCRAVGHKFVSPTAKNQGSIADRCASKPHSSL